MSLNDNYHIINYKNSPYTLEDIKSFIEALEKDFTPPLSERINLTSYVEKLIRESNIIIIKNSINEAIVGMIAFYCTPRKYDTALISFFGVVSNARGKGLGSLLLSTCKQLVYQSGMKAIETRTWESNNPALYVYQKQGFIVEDRKLNKEANRFEVIIRLTFDESNGGE